MSIKFTEFDFTINANDINAVTDAVDISENSHASYSVANISGAHTAHKIKLQCSLDGINWGDADTGLVGTGMTDNIHVTAKYVRGKVSIAEGSVSLVKVYIQGK